MKTILKTGVMLACLACTASCGDDASGTGGSAGTGGAAGSAGAAGTGGAAGSGGAAGMGGVAGSGGAAGMGGSVGENEARCNSFCNVFAVCLGGDANTCVVQCLETFAAAESAMMCFDELVAFLACGASLSCPELEALDETIPPDAYPCIDQDIALQDCGLG